LWQLFLLPSLALAQSYSHIQSKLGAGCPWLPLVYWLQVWTTAAAQAAAILLTSWGCLLHWLLTRCCWCWQLCLLPSLAHMNKHSMPRWFKKWLPMSPLVNWLQLWLTVMHNFCTSSCTPLQLAHTCCCTMLLLLAPGVVGLAQLSCCPGSHRCYCCSAPARPVGASLTVNLCQRTPCPAALAAAADAGAAAAATAAAQVGCCCCCQVAGLTKHTTTAT
jgi:hypothetical protein